MERQDDIDINGFYIKLKDKQCQGMDLDPHQDDVTAIITMDWNVRMTAI